jgi:ABC-2 type transport system permease protein
MMGAIADRIVRAFGVDPMQWRARVITALRVDLRTASAISLSRMGPSTGARSLSGFVASLVFMSLALMLFVAFAQDLFFSLTIYFSFLIFSIGTSLLLEFQSIVLSPDDHRQLAYHPIDSRTFFAARLTAVLVYVGIMTASLGALPSFATAFASQGGWLVALAVVIASTVAAVTTTFLAIGAYVLLLHYVSTARLSRALTYLQLGATFLVYGSYFALPRLIGEGLRAGRLVDPDGWILVLPGTWFASYAAIVTGHASTMHVALAALTLVILAIGMSLTAGRVSLDYADRLALLTSSTASRPDEISRSVRTGWLFRDGERRAIALLVRALFRHDMKFRLGVLTIVPLTIVYLFAGGGMHMVTDPFVSAGTHEPQFVYFAILFFPSMLRHALSKSDAWRAAWVLYATPADSARLVLGMKDFVLLMFVVPYLLFLGVLIGWGFERIEHLAVLLVTLGLLTHLLAVCELWISPELPFSQPAARGSRTREMLILICVVSMLAPLMPLLLHLAFATPARVVGTLTGLVLVNALMVWQTTRRVHRLANAAEFQL